MRSVLQAGVLCVSEKEPRPANGADLLQLLQSLSEHHVDYVLIGGQALNLHGFMRGTADIDLLLPMSEINGRKVLDALAFLQDNAARDVDPAWLTEPGTVRIADEIVIDLMTLAANGETYDSLRDHIEKREAEGYSFYLLDIEGLIRTKQSVRTKDKLDLDILHRMKLQRSQEQALKEPGSLDKTERKTGPEI